MDILGRVVPEETLRNLPPVEPAKALQAVAAGRCPGFLPFVEDAPIDEPPAAMVFDLNAWENNLAQCKLAFGKGFLHAIALKANPVAAIMRTAKAMDCGAECASIGEVVHALALGWSPEEIVFDSPAKTVAELRFALNKGLHVNVDNWQELGRVERLLANECKGSSSVVGVRINPLVGAGEIQDLSVSTGDGKFGIPISERSQLFEAYTRFPWLRSVHVHVGSGGMGAEILVRGIEVAVDFAIQVNEHVGNPQVTRLDMGGGWPVNYTSDAYVAGDVGTFFDYVEALRARVPRLFPDHEQSPFDRVITEFGQALNAKAAWFVSRVEYTKPFRAPDGAEGQVAILHFGADVCVRQCYTGEHNRRIEVFGAEDGGRKQGDPILHNIAGPLCFQGDHLAKGVQLPKLEPNDFVVLRDAGASTISLSSRHCSRQGVAVYGYRDGPLELLKPAEPLQAIPGYWGCTPEEQDRAAAALK